MTNGNHSDDELIRYHPSAAHPGWNEWSLLERDAHRFNSMLQPILTRAEPDGTARVRFIPGDQHSNVSNYLHGGAPARLSGYSDVCGSAHFGYPHRRRRRDRRHTGAIRGQRAPLTCPSMPKSKSCATRAA